VLTCREGHNPEIASHLPVAAEPRPGERCILCAEPADKVVLGAIERESGLRRRTPVCTKCANASGRLEHRMVSDLSVEQPGTDVLIAREDGDDSHWISST